jgi:hypothetical protein
MGRKRIDSRLSCPSTPETCPGVFWRVLVFSLSSGERSNHRALPPGMNT